MSVMTKIRNAITKPFRSGYFFVDTRPSARMIKKVTGNAKALVQNGDVVLVDTPTGVVIQVFQVDDPALSLPKEVDRKVGLAIFALGYNSALCDVNTWKRSELKPIIKMLKHAAKSERAALKGVVEKAPLSAQGVVSVAGTKSMIPPTLSAVHGLRSDICADPFETRETREAPETREARATRESRESREARESREDREKARESHTAISTILAPSGQPVSSAGSAPA